MKLGRRGFLGTLATLPFVKRLIGDESSTVAVPVQIQPKLRDVQFQPWMLSAHKRSELRVKMYTHIAEEQEKRGNKLFWKRWIAK